MVFDIEPSPALAEAPIPIPWNIGITRKIMHKASSANNGTTINPKFLLTISAIHYFNSFLAKKEKKGLKARTILGKLSYLSLSEKIMPLAWRFMTERFI